MSGYRSYILMYDHSTDSGHGGQVPCEHHTEPDGLDEGELSNAVHYGNRW